MDEWLLVHGQRIPEFGFDGPSLPLGLDIADTCEHDQHEDAAEAGPVLGLGLGLEPELELEPAPEPEPALVLAPEHELEPFVFVAPVEPDDFAGTNTAVVVDRSSSRSIASIAEASSEPAAEVVEIAGL